MKNAIIGFFSLLILLLAGFAINTAEGRTLRQNELSSTLSASMEKSMEILMTKKDYTISEQKEFVADFIQNAMVKMNSDSTYDVEIFEVDIEKGLLDAKVTETYKQFLRPGKVSVRKTVILEEYENIKNEYFLVTFQDADGKIVKQVNVHGGDSLNEHMLPVDWKDKTFVCLETDIEYTAADVDQIMVTEDLTFKLKGEAPEPAKTYTVKYNANGGIGSMEDSIFNVDESCQLSKNKFAMVSSNMIFTGWNTQADGSGTAYSDGQYVKNLTTGGKTITLYAQWQKSQGKYYVEYDGNGGSGYMNITSHEVGVGGYLAENKFRRDGYDFIGWNTQHDGSGKSYKAGEFVNFGLQKDQHILLHAQWKKRPDMDTITIRFDANGGTGTMESLTVKVGESFQLPVNKFTRNGCQFMGWSTNKDGTGTLYQDQEYIQDIGVAGGGGITLYARWIWL